jgi:hypothetical protein
MVDDGGEVCQSLAGMPVDTWMSALVLQALAPAALEVSLAVAADAEAQRPRWHQHWAKRRARAADAVARAARPYQAVEPDNRLVARTLERPWAEAWEAEAQRKADYRRFVAAQPATRSREEREAIRRLATALPTLWHAETTTAGDRQAMIRQLVERIVVTVQGASAQVDREMHWIGGHRTPTRRMRPVARLAQLSYSPELLARVAALHQQGLGRTAIAQHLNAEGWRPAKRRQTFTADMVRSLLARQGLCPSPSRPRAVARTTDEWTLPEWA